MELDTLFVLILTLISILACIIYFFEEIYLEHGIYGMWSKIFDWRERLRITMGIKSDIWGQLSSEEIEVIKDIYFTARSNDVKFTISENSKIEYPVKSKTLVSGYFIGDENNSDPEFGIAIGGKKEDWFLVFLHESCHMDQWLNKSSIWSNCQIGGRDAYDMLDEWINGENKEDWEIEKVIKSCIDIELDCEKRVVEKINKYTLTDIDKIEYVKKANSYVMFYGAILKTRKWYINSPYEIKEIWEKMPIIFLEKNYYFNIKDGYLELYKKYCFDSE